MSKQYPLHPGQTHATPLYTQLPLEEYEAIMKENARMKEALKRHDHRGLRMAQETKKPEEQKKEEAKKLLRPQSFHVNVRTCGAMGRL